MTRLHGGTFRLLTAAGLLLIACSLRAGAQTDDGHTPVEPSGGIRVHAGIGVHTMWINGDVQAQREISPPNPELPGGGITGISPGIHAQVEILPNSDSRFRFPISVDAFFLSGKTTYALPPLPGQAVKPLERLLLSHTANIFGIGAGLMYSIIKKPNIYVSGQATLNYIPPTDYVARQYRAIDDSTIVQVVLHPDTSGHVRGGAFIQAGVQVDFFEPLLLDFSVGYGAVNILGRDTDPNTRRNLLIVDSDKGPKADPEFIIGYIGIGFSVIWKF
ncbi:MAG: hypothetical protein JWQ98_1827 [Chlorobi bacterium]|nr:hypothetical protein [Chlorobiota bacterium]